MLALVVMHIYEIIYNFYKKYSKTPIVILKLKYTFLSINKKSTKLIVKLSNKIN